MVTNLREVSIRSPFHFSFFPSLLSWPFHGRSPSPSHFHVQSSSLQTLAFEEVQSSEGPTKSTALFLHGLLGSARQWRTFSRNLSSELKRRSPSNHWRMVLVDLRNHGRSAGIRGLEPPHDMVNAAKDLANLVKSQGWMWPEVVVGHSMGGKVALEFGASCARGDYGETAVLPKQLWVLDSIPGEVNSDDSNGEMEKILETLECLPSSLPSRKWVVDHMLGLGFSKLVSKWIASNLKQEGGHLEWAFQLPAAIEMFKSYRERSYWSLLELPPKGLEIAVVRAENSDRWPQHVIKQLESLPIKGKKLGEGKFSYHVLPKSGHWVHVDNPEGLLDIMTPNFYCKA